MTTASCKSCLQQRLCSHSAPCSLLPSPPPPPSSLYPNVDFYSGIVLRALGIPVEMYTVLFAMARTVGWVAQVSRRRAVCGLCVAGRSRAGEWRGSGGVVVPSRDLPGPREAKAPRGDSGRGPIAAGDRPATGAIERVAHRPEAGLRRPVRVVDARLPRGERRLVA